MSGLHSLLATVVVALASASPATAPDYSQAADWICRPGAESVCTSGLDARVDAPQSASRVESFAPASDPAIDCFYVYPTVSQEESVSSDLAQSPEIKDAVNRQAGRLTSRCRVFAPVYRQLTIYGLRKMMRGEIKADDSGDAFGDVAAAWAYYLAHDNGGRGVVLIGHSQGTILLQRLIAEKIDGTPQQKLLVSAFLAGDPSLAVPKGKTVGGTFAHVPLCATKAQTGCAYAWGSYLSDDDSPLFTFGTPLDNGMASACDNPAAPGGGTAPLKYFHRKPAGSAAEDAPWIETLGQLAGACVSDSRGSAFVVSVKPGPRASQLKTLLSDAEILSGWGLHLIDIGLVQGNMLDVLDAETATWLRK
jgi:hypothetical protein